MAMTGRRGEGEGVGRETGSGMRAGAGAHGEAGGGVRGGPGRARPGGPGGVPRPGWGSGDRGGGAAAPGGAPDGGTGPLIVTEDPGLLDDLLRLCAAAGARPLVLHTLPERRGEWEAAPLVLIGDDAAARVDAAPRRQGVLLVGRDRWEPAVWQWAVRVGAEHVLRLPEAEAWLVDRIADVVEGAGRSARTVGVVGGRGGAGASTLACALAVTAAAGGSRTVLVDADPLGGGLDVLLGGEQAEGLRWPAFARSRGRVARRALEEALPEVHGLRLLSWDRSDTAAVAPQAVRAVLGAARRGGGTVVVDLPRRAGGEVAEALAQLDLALLVVPAELRAVAAARRMAAVLIPEVRDLRVVVRPAGAPGVPGHGLASGSVAGLLGLPLAGVLPHDPAAVEAQETGPPPGSGPRGPLARFCRELWDRAAGPGPVPDDAPEADAREATPGRGGLLRSAFGGNRTATPSGATA
ncbi:Septum formation initiator OS=Streptomyces gougerotii OX=53448 GN=GCM10010227_41280 PE=4 SV=1 [Streptomyces diastaticus subsp. diastaticus]|uniref:Septum site determining protein n=1 Tax=Streptomyces griseus TaxID=1911 RepID=A0A380NZI2_STRGR|nr:Septum site determining protein [Streptomyces griseus]